MLSKPNPFVTDYLLSFKNVLDIYFTFVFFLFFYFFNPNWLLVSLFRIYIVFICSTFGETSFTNFTLNIIYGMKANKICRFVKKNPFFHFSLVCYVFVFFRIQIVRIVYNKYRFNCLQSFIFSLSVLQIHLLFVSCFFFIIYLLSIT